jgi:hypothetical protein
MIIATQLAGNCESQQSQRVNLEEWTEKSVANDEWRRTVVQK